MFIYKILQSEIFAVWLRCLRTTGKILYEWELKLTNVIWLRHSGLVSKAPSAKYFPRCQ